MQPNPAIRQSLIRAGASFVLATFAFALTIVMMGSPSVEGTKPISVSSASLLFLLCNGLVHIGAASWVLSRRHALYAVITTIIPIAILVGLMIFVAPNFGLDDLPQKIPSSDLSFLARVVSSTIVYLGAVTVVLGVGGKTFLPLGLAIYIVDQRISQK